MNQRIWMKWALSGVAGSVLLLLLLLWFACIRQGKRFALRDRLRKADAIVVLAGTRGHLAYLEGKIRTAVRLYQQGYAPFLLCVGKFSDESQLNSTIGVD